MLFLAALSAGCSGDGQTAAPTVSEGETVVRTFGFRPTWDVEDMVKRFDRIAGPQAWTASDFYRRPVG